LANYSSNPGIGYELAELADDYADAKRYDEAAALYRQAVERWPSSKWAVEAQKRLARMYVQIGDYEKADAAAGKLIEAFSNAEGIAAAVEDVADKYQLAGSHAKSYPLHRYVVEHWPENERAIWCQMKAIMSQLRLGDLAKAEQELGNLLTGFAGHKELGPAVHEVVEEYRNTGAHEEGRELFAYLLENWDETPDTMLELQVGIALQSIKLGELDKGDAAVQKLIADYNDHPRIGKALFQIAEEHYYAGDYVRAGDLWKRVLSDYPQSSFESQNETPYLIATCARALGKPEEAIRYYTVSIEKYPQGRYTYRAPYRIALEYRRARDPNEALYWLDKQRELYTEELHSQRALFEYAAVYHWDLKDYEKAIQACQDYLAQYPDDEHTWPAYYLWAKSLEKRGNKSEAIAVLQEALAEFAGTELEQRISEAVTRIEKGGEK
jgi:tetratricopeptide (TPR) repeat protein